MHSNPIFIIYTGPMFSTKTSSLLAVLERYRYQHKRIMAFKPQIDDRYSLDEIVSHSGGKTPAYTVTSGADILRILSEQELPSQVIAVDEAFMIPGVAEAMIWLYRNGFDVIVSSLELSAAGKSFHEIEKMMPWATRIVKCSAVCVVCGRDAHFTHKKQLGPSDEIEVGGDEMYEPRCHRHHPLVNRMATIPEGEEDAEE